MTNSTEGFGSPWIDWENELSANGFSSDDPSLIQEVPEVFKFRNFFESTPRTLLYEEVLTLTSLAMEKIELDKFTVSPLVLKDLLQENYPRVPIVKTLFKPASVPEITSAAIEHALNREKEDPKLVPRAEDAPPSSALLSAFLPVPTAEDAIANLNEVFADLWLPRHGHAKARRIWKMQAFRITLHYWLPRLFDMLDRIKRLTFS
jgi:hypothetical protein